MPKLIIFAACEKALLDDTGNASLIQLAQTISTLYREGTKVPANLVGSKEWSIYSLWKQEDGDVGKPFVQVIQVLWPDKTEFKKLEMPVVFEKGRNHQVRLNVVGFPLGQTGEVVVNAWLELNAKAIGRVHSWEILVKHESREVLGDTIKP